MARYRYSDLDRVVDDVHATFDAWAAQDAFRSVLGDSGLDVLRLAVHEWVANLVQHASFPGTAEIRMEVTVRSDAVRCVVEDTSAGFDFADQVERQQLVLNAATPSERGRGLLMLVMCAEDLDFRPAAPGVDQRIAFALRKPVGGDLAPLFHRDDVAGDGPSPVEATGAASGDGAWGDVALVAWPSHDAASAPSVR